jgi:hypothetical protein
MSLPLQVALLGIAVPQVVAQRLARMAIAGASPSASDRKEFARMGTEKIAAFHQSWNAVALHAVQAYQQWVMSWMLQVWLPWSLPKFSMKRARLDPRAVQALGKAVAPFRRRAVANAKRLSRVRRR